MQRSDILRPCWLAQMLFITKSDVASYSTEMIDIKTLLKFQERRLQTSHYQTTPRTKITSTMAFGRSRARHQAGGATVTTTVTTVEHPGPTTRSRAMGTKPTLRQRLFGPKTRTPRTTTATPTRRRHAGTRRTPATTTTTPRRKASMSDKVSGAMLKLKGSLTRRPGQKAAGTRRMRGTDGRGSGRYY
ncbi:hypothetical protein PV04_06476 [Phialophora macrospora]|uniref:Uncharacterized protein n=1 Tax=Phialophora macrospora TaxID=1851006 RepID=A0A0D2G5B6_9EURO|nr:hypothetical protein PV04_06476 [Phialophora macrospora]